MMMSSFRHHKLGALLALFISASAQAAAEDQAADHAAGHEERDAGRGGLLRRRGLADHAARRRGDEGEGGALLAQLPQAGGDLELQGRRGQRKIWSPT